MTIIQEIHEWSRVLPAWQQDAIARLYWDRTLTSDDINDLYALAKQEAGIPDPSGRIPKKLEDTQVAAPTASARIVKLAAVKELSNVNALADGGGIPFALNGLTVIYGENGAGKSGYSRIFKHACRARDQREPVLPNANLAPKNAGVARAVFEAVIDGTLTELPWQYGSVAPEPLSEIAIFDSACARAYVDNQGDFAYTPSGLDILEGLAAVCGRLKALATEEKVTNTPSDAVYVALMREQTKVATVLSGIPATTKPEHIETLASLSQMEKDRLALLTKTLAEADPKQKAQALKQKTARLIGLKNRTISAIQVMSDEAILNLRHLIDKSNTAKVAASLAASEFKNTPDQLSGTGDEAWKLLFEAARDFSKISHAEHEFPHLPDDAQCPLCQNELGKAGVLRLVHFDAFIKQSSEQAAKDARDIAASAYKVLKAAVLDIAFRDGLVEELTEIAPELAPQLIEIQQCLTRRQKTTLLAAASEVPWAEITKLPSNPIPRLNEIIEALNTETLALEATADENVRNKMISEKRELDARVRLSEIKSAVLETLAKHEYCKILQKCLDGFDTRAISRKSTMLSETIASQELADALTYELKRLKVDHLQVVMKPESPGGKTKFKLVLQLPGGGTPSKILSEGEQRAIAIASFLTEIKLGKRQGGIVLDDPVSSLDHRRRWEVAERLAFESRTRQVIIFTHDIYFLCILEQKAEELGTEITKNYIRKTVNGYGVHSQDLPFDVIGTKERIGRLRQELVGIRRVHYVDDDECRRLTSACYGQLRLAWERCVEEVLLNGAVQRFGEGVSTQRLKSVVVTDEDYKEVEAGMSKSSKFEHDAAIIVGRLPIPVPDELEKDIDRLAGWRDAVNKRLLETAKQRG